MSPQIYVELLTLHEKEKCMSHGVHLNHHAVEGAAGLAAELAKQGGYLSSQAGNTAYRALTGTHTGHMGAQAVQSLAQYAPAVVMALGTVAPPLAVVAGMGYGVYKLFKWLND
jgi:hypothetical protein